MDKKDLLQEIDRLNKLVLEKDQQIDHLNELLETLKRKRFGSSSEKLKNKDLGTFNEAEELDSDDIIVPEHKRKRGGRKKLPDELPREEIIIELDENDRICPTDGSILEEIGEDISEDLEIIPAKVIVKRIIKKKYACKVCNKSLKTAKAPDKLISKSFATASLIAYLAVSKYMDALPLYRLEKMFERIGIEVSRQSFARWMIRLGEALTPLINLLEDELLSSSYINMDETTVQVLKEKNKRAESKSYMWARYRAGPKAVVLFNYDSSRSSTVPIKLLEGFEGYLQVDGYDGYAPVCSQNPNIKRVGCFAHARRKFFDAFKSSNGKSIGKDGLNFIKKLYKVEDKTRAMSFEDRKSIRNLESRPILEDFYNWIIKHKDVVRPKSLAAKAIGYTFNEWDYLMRFLEDGRIEIDNNVIENSIRPFTLGRKNWLFSDTVDGAHASANIYSIIQTAKRQDINVYDYLKYVIERLPVADSLDDYEQLLPWNYKSILE